MRKAFELIEETYGLETNVIKFATLQPQLTQLQSHPNLPWKTKFGVPFLK